jgi:hypothetical protein
VLNRLGGREQTGIKSRRALILFHNLRTFIGNADNGVTRFALRPFVDSGEDFFEARHVAFQS